jgi:predicted RNase H-like HicB family nuclease
MKARKFIVTMTWCYEDGTGAWCATSDDIPGLVLESDTFDTLVERVKLAAPEMLECNLNYTGAIELYFETKRVEYLAAVS